MNNAVTHLLYNKNFKYYLHTRFEGWVQLQNVGAKKFQIDIFLLLPATRFHKVKIESQRWKSSIKVYSIARFIFQWQLASDMIKDVFTLEQKVK